MKRTILISISLFFIFSLEQLSAQTTRHAWTDSLAMTTTPFDTAFTTERFETAVIRFVGCAGYIRYALSTQDTAGWTRYEQGKNYTELAENAVLNIIKNPMLGIPGLYRIEARAKSGTGILYINGTKKTYE